jgi:hypothetical protein
VSLEQGARVVGASLDGRAGDRFVLGRNITVRLAPITILGKRTIPFTV